MHAIVKETGLSWPGFTEPFNAMVQGASRGLGLAITRLLVEDNSVRHVLATCRNPNDAHDLQLLLEQNQTKLTIIGLDVSNEKNIATGAELATHLTSQIRLLINCAGILHDDTLRPEKQIKEVSVDALQRYFLVNAFGPLLILKHFKSLLAPRDRVLIGNLSARVGSIGDNHLGGWYGYRASKAAQNMFTRGVAIEFRRKNPDFICVSLHPGTVATTLSEPFRHRIRSAQLQSPAAAAMRLLQVLSHCKPVDSGEFFAYDGTRIPW